MNSRRGYRLIMAAALVAFCATACPGIAWIPAARSAEPRNLGEARNHYEFAEFTQALDICNELINGGALTGNDLRDANVLKARCLVNLGNHSMAQEGFCSALKVDKAWRPAPDLLTKDEQADFDLALAGCKLEVAPAPASKPAPVIPSALTPPSAAGAAESKPFYKKPLFLALGGAILIGGVVALAGGGSKGGGGTPSGPLPGFPPPPTGR